MFHVEKMTARDFDFAVRLTDTMNWQLTEEDFKFMLRLEPEGCFVLLDDSRRVGVLTTISFDRIGWIGNVIVDEEYRKKGAGSMLVKHAMDYLASRVETVGLYAYMNTISFYSRLGFTYDSDFVILQGKASSSPKKTTLRKANEEDVSAIIECDELCFGASRKKLLEPIMINGNNLCYVSFEDGEMLGYAMAKVYEGAAELGPLVCREDCGNVAIDLLKTILTNLNNFDFLACVPAKESLILDFLKNSGLVEKFRVARMFSQPIALKKCVYMAESAERG
jgi:ribosomal protein S18 acetylase RimI-like enzyme